MLLTIAIKLIIIAIMDSNVLPEHNPWWRRPEFILEDNFIIELERQKYRFRHPLLSTFPLNSDGILTVRGPRRIGKTTLLKLLIQRLLMDDHVERENVLFFPCDTVKDYKELESLLVGYLNHIRPRTGTHLYIFLDEISFVKEWQRAIKLLVDTARLKGATVLVSGSSTLDLKFSAERLPGRRGEIYPWDIVFLPLTFNEFVTLLQPELLSDPPGKALSLLPHFQKLFSDYLICGGFPVTLNEYFDKGYIATQTYEIFNAWIEGDLHRAGKSESSAYQIVKRLFAHLTSTVSFYKLSRESGIASHTTVEEYLEILEKMFVLFRLPFFSLEQKQVFFRKSSKFYFIDPFILNCLKARVDGFQLRSFAHSRDFVRDDRNRAALVENFVAAHLQRTASSLHFGRAGNDREIDFVALSEGAYSFVEVKYQEHVKEEEFRWARTILGKDMLTVLSRSDFHEDSISIIPAELFLAHFRQN